jgi:transcriptional regulator NrdR
MKCPYCGAQDKDHVLDSRPVREGAAIKRRRECEACKGRFTTFEEIEELRLMVVKGRGRAREPFDRAKLRRAIELACKKRPVTEDQVTQVADDIERLLYSRQDKEVLSSESVSWSWSGCGRSTRSPTSASPRCTGSSRTPGSSARSPTGCAVPGAAANNGTSHALFSPVRTTEAAPPSRFSCWERPSIPSNPLEPRA